MSDSLKALKEARARLDSEPPSINRMIYGFIQGDHQCRGNIVDCFEAGNGECVICGQRDCPHGEPLHYHHDGCPACIFDEPEHYDGNWGDMGLCGRPKCMEKERKNHD